MRRPTPALSSTTTTSPTTVPPASAPRLPAVFVALAALAGLASGPWLGSEAVAQGPVGPELQINEETTGTQRLPQLARRDDGTFLVIWQTSEPFRQNRVRVFDSVGQPLTPEQPIGDDIRDVVPDPNGGYLIARDVDLGPFTEQRVRRLDADGLEVGDEYRVHETTGFRHLGGKIDVHPAGGFLVVWSQTNNVLSRRLDANGVPVGSQSILATSPASDRGQPYVAVNGNGNFVASWSEDGRIRTVFGDADGSPLSPPTVVAPAVPAPQLGGRVDADSANRFFVVWNQDRNSVRGAWLNDAGQTVFDLELATGVLGSGPQVDCDGSTRCAVVWETGRDILARWRTSSAFIGDEITVNAFTPLTQRNAQIECGADGHCVAVWESGQRSSIDEPLNGPDGSEGAIRAQRFTFNETFSVAAEPARRQICAGEGATFDLSLTRWNGFNSGVNLSITPPTGSNASLTPASLGPLDSSSELHFFDTAGLTPGLQETDVVSTDADGLATAHRVTVGLDVIPSTPPVAESPADGTAYCAGEEDTFHWTPILGDPLYTVELSRDAAFTDLVTRIETRRWQADVPNDLAPGRYFWRVSACPSFPSQVFTFTVDGDCGPDAIGEVARLDDVGTPAFSIPAVTLGCDGRALAIWKNDGEGETGEIRGRWLVDGTPAGPSFQVDGGSGSSETPLAARINENGDYVALWRDGLDLRWRVYDGSTLAGGPIQSATLDEVPRSVDVAASGDVAGVWSADGAVRGRRFDSTGSPIGGLFDLVPQGAPEVGPGFADIAQTPDGFVVAFSSSDYSQYLTTRVHGARFNDGGDLLGSDFVVASADFGIPAGSSVGSGRVKANSRGEFVIHFGQTTTDYYANVFTSAGFSIYDSEGVRQGGQGIPDAGFHDVAITEDLDFLVVWSDPDFELSGSRLLGDAFERTPAKKLATEGPQRIALAVGAPSTAGLAVWRSEACGEPCMLARSIRSGPGLLIDGFESGDVSRWCGTVGEEESATGDQSSSRSAR
ncbi:MAG: hypothetical protein AAGM22_05455 [Acidobacteriota bacterium]